MGKSGPRFARESRLIKPAQFQRVFQNHCKSGDAHLLVLARGNDLGQARLGLAIPNRSVGKAVARNRIKRVIRESFRRQQSQLGGLDLIVKSRSGADKKTNDEIRAALEKHWSALVQCKKS